VAADDGVQRVKGGGLTVSFAMNSRVALTLLLTVLTALVGCSAPEKSRFDYFRVTIDGEQVLGISANDVLTRAVVVFFHGPGGNEFSIGDPEHLQMTTDLVNAGFAVVASRAGGDAFGNPASQRNYIYLGGAAAEHYGTENIFLLAESMGAVAAANLLATRMGGRVRGFVAINPMLDLAAATPQFQSLVAKSYEAQPLDESNPMNLPVEAFHNKKMKFYVNRDDAKVPAGANAFAFKERFGSTADISIVECSGSTGDKSCYRGADLVKWFADMEKRS
jgi:pimeloyl-ACP methyl ester carboxylesterase